MVGPLFWGGGGARRPNSSSSSSVLSSLVEVERGAFLPRVARVVTGDTKRKTAEWGAFGDAV